MKIQMKSLVTKEKSVWGEEKRESNFFYQVNRNYSSVIRPDLRTLQTAAQPRGPESGLAASVQKDE